ncbi:hypothetical protein GWK91_10490 [Virgibacillus sp. MSP4-1]|uniref:hypothetical protein n=1 Tax=Virgibacillus sp. MSP4-1 TaxID=2700081 RepID=UPI0003A19F54|nr:hypothetical protein [Virgibacillus sp. MSP4-1]QHS23353.1 hypothetical protein GWK91_10490 [Virgibacillus sp. MSP4-1]
MYQDQELVTIEKEMEKAEELLKVNKHDNALQVFVTIYGLGISYLYKNYLGRLEKPEELLDYLREKRINIYSCTFGKYIELVRNTTFIDEVYQMIHPGKRYKKSALIDNLSEINQNRNQVVHPESSKHSKTTGIDRQFVKVHMELLKLFLNDFNLFTKNAFKVVSNYETFNFQKIVGETQLYESLNEVINNEDIDTLDVTYLSPKIPQKQTNHTIKMYWQKVNELLSEDKLTLRRIISFDESDKKELKLLWFLFGQIPDYYQKLNKSAFFSIVNSSALVTRESGEPVNLINLILMYNSNNPNVGHAWVFGSHPNILSSNQEYLHLYGTNLSILRKIYNDFFNSGEMVTEDSLKKMLHKRNDALNEENIDSYIENISKLFPRVGIDNGPDQIRKMMECYQAIMQGTADDVDDFVW